MLNLKMEKEVFVISSQMNVELHAESSSRWSGTALRVLGRLS